MAFLAMLSLSGEQDSIGQGQINVLDRCGFHSSLAGVKNPFFVFIIVLAQCRTKGATPEPSSVAPKGVQPPLPLVGLHLLWCGLGAQRPPRHGLPARADGRAAGPPETTQGQALKPGPCIPCMPHMACMCTSHTQG